MTKELYDIGVSQSRGRINFEANIKYATNKEKEIYANITLSKEDNAAMIMNTEIVFPDGWYVTGVALSGSIDTSISNYPELKFLLSMNANSNSLVIGCASQGKDYIEAFASVDLPSLKFKKMRIDFNWNCMFECII